MSSWITTDRQPGVTQHAAQVTLLYGPSFAWRIPPTATLPLPLVDLAVPGHFGPGISLQSGDHPAL